MTLQLEVLSELDLEQEVSSELELELEFE